LRDLVAPGDKRTEEKAREAVATIKSGPIAMERDAELTAIKEWWSAKAIPIMSSSHHTNRDRPVGLAVFSADVGHAAEERTLRRKVLLETKRCEFAAQPVASSKSRSAAPPWCAIVL
jgi:hypothetical protein